MIRIARGVATVVVLCWAGAAGAEVSVFYPLDEAEIKEYEVEVHTDFCRDGERCDRWIEVVWDAGQVVATQATERNSGWSHDNCSDEETE